MMDEEDLGVAQVVAKAVSLHKGHKGDTASTKTSAKEVVAAAAAAAVTPDGNKKKTERAPVVDTEGVTTNLTTTAMGTTTPVQRKHQDPQEDNPYIGMPICKQFPEGKFFGKVISGPEATAENGSMVMSWRVRYRDGDQEDLTKQELLECAIGKDKYSVEKELEEEEKEELEEEVLEEEDDVALVQSPPKKALLSRMNPEDTATNPEDTRKQVEDDTDVDEEDEQKKPAAKKDDDHHDELNERDAANKRMTTRERQPPSHLNEYETATMAHHHPRKRKHQDFNEEPCVGMKIRKLFDDGIYYRGKVISGPEATNENGKVVMSWRVRYQDGDHEDLDMDELLECAVREEDEDDEEEPSGEEVEGKDDKTSKPPRKHAPPSQRTWDYATAKRDLCFRMGVTEVEVVAALSQMKPPYGLNKAMQLIHQAKKQQDTDDVTDEERFNPRVGLRIRKNFDGSAYHGTVTKDAEWLEVDGLKVKMWEVTYDDGEKEDFEFHELMRCRASRPMRMHPVRGRQLCCLELFSGCGVVTQEFADRKWRVRSIDNSPTSYATDRLDIMKLKYSDIDMIPDFIWASPPCFTYSNLSGGKHRNPEKGEFEKTPEAREHNRLLAQMFAIMKWARSHNPHLLVVIENPVGFLRKMPLMKEIVETMGLYPTIVHYCALGREDKKPTYIWTNDFRLHGTLAEFKCDSKCPFAGGTHPIGARSHGRQWNAAAIPKALAEEVAEHVHSTFYERRIRYTKEPEMSPEEVERFDQIMSM